MTDITGSSPSTLKPSLRDAAALLWAAEVCVLDFPGRPDVALAWCLASWRALENPSSPWFKRRHEGDCTKVPCSCLTCQVETWERKAFNEFAGPENDLECTREWVRP